LTFDPVGSFERARRERGRRNGRRDGRRFEFVRGGRGGGGEVWFRTLLETLEKAGKSTALAVAHFLDALIQLTRSGNTKSLRNAFGNSMHNRPIAAPPLGIHREGHNRRHMLGADQGAIFPPATRLSARSASSPVTPPPLVFGGARQQERPVASGETRSFSGS